MDPKFAKGYYRLAYALKDMGEIDEALAKLEEGLKVVEKGKKALQQLKKKFSKYIDQDPTEQVEAFPSVKESLISTPNSLQSAGEMRMPSTQYLASVGDTDAFTETAHSVPVGQGEVKGSKTTAQDDEVKPVKKMSKFKRERMKLKQGMA